MLTACSACGAHQAHAPALARADARPLSAIAQRIAREGPCAQRRDIALLQRRTIALVKTRRVPAALQEPLVGGVNALAAQTPVCIPAVPVATTPTPPPAPPAHGHEKHPKPPHDHGHGHDHGHHGGEGD